MVDYNDAAIKFYNKNSFMTSRTIKDHYVIKGKQYDAVVMYKDLSPSYLQQRQNEDNPNMQQWSYYDYARFPYEYLREYYERM